MSVEGLIVRQGWLDIAAHFPNVRLDEYVVMPNHLHGLIIIDDTNGVGAGFPRPAPVV